MIYPHGDDPGPRLGCSSRKWTVTSDQELRGQGCVSVMAKVMLYVVSHPEVIHATVMVALA